MNKVIINVKMYEGGRLISGLESANKDKIVGSLQIKRKISNESYALSSFLPNKAPVTDPSPQKVTDSMRQILHPSKSESTLNRLSSRLEAKMISESSGSKA